MGQDEKTRPANVREKSKLRATLGDAPDGGYSFHDEARVETVRTSPTRPIRISVTPKAGGTNAREESGSWPPMPTIPPELEGAATDPPPQAEEADPDDIEGLVTNPPPRARPRGSAIWEALPSVIQERAADNDEALEASSGPDATPDEDAEDARPSLLELGRTNALESRDSDLTRFERLVERGAWEQLDQELSTHTQRSPTMTLLLAVARRESRVGDEKQNVVLTRETISALAKVLELPETSPTALMLSKRLLRKNPWHRAQKPSNKLSIGLIFMGVSVGAGIGWLVTKFLL